MLAIRPLAVRVTGRPASLINRCPRSLELVAGAPLIGHKTSAEPNSVRDYDREKKEADKAKREVWDK